MKSKVICIGRADIKNAEKMINEQLKDVQGFQSLKVTSNGQNDIAVVLYDGESTEESTTKTMVKIVEFPVTDNDRAAEIINNALDGIETIAIEPTVIREMNRLFVVYEGEEEEIIVKPVPYVPSTELSIQV